MIQSKTWRRRAIFLMIGTLFLIITGLTVTAGGEYTVHLVYGGYTYETPVIIAVQKGFFKEEGLKVELVRSSFENLQQEITSGQVDGLTADYRIFNPIAKGLKLKLIAGLHCDCVRIIAAASSKIKSVTDLKNKNIGVEAIGNGPMVVSSRLLRENGIDTVKQLTWKTIPKIQLIKALAEGTIDAAALWESTNLSPNLNNTIVIFSSSQNKSFMNQHNSFPHFYDSFIGLSDRFVKDNPQTAVAVSRAWLKATRWVGENSKQAAQIYITQCQISNKSQVEIEPEVLKGMWMPGVHSARENIRFYIVEQKELGILHPNIDVNQLFNRIYAPIIPDFNEEDSKVGCK